MRSERKELLRKGIAQRRDLVGSACADDEGGTFRHVLLERVFDDRVKSRRVRACAMLRIARAVRSFRLRSEVEGPFGPIHRITFMARMPVRVFSSQHVKPSSNPACSSIARISESVSARS